MRYCIALLVISVCSLFSAVELEVSNSKWQLIGIHGVYIDGLNPPIFGTAGIVVDDVVDADGNVSYYSGTTTTVSTVANDKTVGFLAIENAISPSGLTTLNINTRVFFEITTLLNYNSGQTRYRMYIAGKNGIPAVRIDFQADLIGRNFKVRFGSETTFYTASFNPNNTYDSPQLLSENSNNINSVVNTTKILDVFDINLSDNNLSNISINNATSYIQQINASGDVNVTLYTLTNSGTWSLWDSRNSIPSTNGFNDLTSGRGYWIFANSNLPSPVHHGFILGDQGINNATHNNIYNGWNLLSFRDSNIRYSPTGFFIPLGEFASGVSVSFRSSIDEVNVSSFTTRNAARKLNWAIEDKIRKSGASTHFKAYPAQKRNPIGSLIPLLDGVIIVSDDKMDVNVSNATNLSGRALKTAIYDSYTRYSTLFGDYMIAFKLNDLNNHEINSTINISMPAYNPNVVTITDLNTTANINAISLLGGFSRAARSTNINKPDANVSVYRIDLDLEPAGALDYETFLLASNGRFSIQDALFVKKFRLLDDGNCVIVGSQNRRLTSVSQIDTFKNITNVKYIDLLNNEFMIVSNRASNLDLLENSGYTMFLDEPTITATASIELAKGAITSVYTHLNLLSPSVTYDDEPIYANIVYNNALNGDGRLLNISSYTSNLKGSPMVALDFPSDGPLNDFSEFGKTISQIVAATTVNETRDSNNSLVWSITDLTKSPKDWFNINDTQDIFTLKKEKGYWVNIKDFSSMKLSIDSSSSLSLSTTTHFDNNITVNANNKIGLVTNHINHFLSLKIQGLNPLESTAYDVTAIIRGKRFPLIASGIRFTLQINDINMDLEESIEGSTLDDSIKLQIYDGIGNSLTNVDYSVHFIKPSKPSTIWLEDGELSVIAGNNHYEIHNQAILDTSPKSSIIMEDSSLIYQSPKITWKSVDGNVTLLRIIAKKDGVYSDMSITPFVPLKDSHILQVKNAQEVDKIPYSFVSNGILKKNDIEIDNGVQITDLLDVPILMSYRPENEGLEELPSFGGTTTMYLARTIAGASVTIGYITYVKAYANKLFYIYYDNTLYQGYFSNDNSHAIQNNAYDLTSGVIDFSDLSLIGDQGNRIDFNGYSGSIQPIYEPDAVTILNNGINTPGGQQPKTGGIVPPQPILPTN
jgi:hypothetical protein